MSSLQLSTLLPKRLWAVHPLLRMYFKPLSKSTGVNFYPESARPLGCTPSQLRLNKTKNQLKHAEKPAQPPQRVSVLPVCELSYVVFDCSEHQATLKRKKTLHNQSHDYSTKTVFTSLLYSLMQEQISPLTSLPLLGTDWDRINQAIKRSKTSSEENPTVLKYHRDVSQTRKAKK